MADYTVTVIDRAPAYAILKYAFTAGTAPITLSDLPDEPMQLLQATVSLNVLDPSNIKRVFLGLEEADARNAIAARHNLSLISGLNYLIFIPGAVTTTEYSHHYGPLASVPLVRASVLRPNVMGVYGEDFDTLQVHLICAYSLPRSVRDLITRTTYRDADGYIIS